MKSLSIIAAIVFITLGSVVAQPKYTQSTYSSANYKMPANAKIAKDLNLDKTQSYEYVAPENKGMESSDNYKNSFAKKEDKGAVMPILPVDNSASTVASGNYKMQFRGTKKVKKQDVEQPKEEPLVLKPTEE